MSLHNLPLESKSLLRRAVEVVYSLKVIEDIEFQTRIGLNRSEIYILLNTWNELTIDNLEFSIASAINNCCNELLFGVRFTEDQWKNCMRCEPQDLIKALNAYRLSQSWPIIIPD